MSDDIMEVTRGVEYPGTSVKFFGWRETRFDLAFEFPKSPENPAGVLFFFEAAPNVRRNQLRGPLSTRGSLPAVHISWVRLVSGLVATANVTSSSLVARKTVRTANPTELLTSASFQPLDV
jgi:hypothetical protein